MQTPAPKATQMNIKVHLYTGNTRNKYPSSYFPVKSIQN